MSHLPDLSNYKNEADKVEILLPFLSDIFGELPTHISIKSILIIISMIIAVIAEKGEVSDEDLKKYLQETLNFYLYRRS